MKLDKLFCDGVVLAEEKPVRVFGEGEGTITVKLCGASATAEAKDGRWIAELPAMMPGGPYTLEVTCDGETALARDVYIGKVYLVAGQSNAEFQLRDSSEPKSNYEDDDLLRNFFVKRPWHENDPFDPGAGWLRAKKDEVGAWSAISYLAGREVKRLTEKAVGVITCAQSASVIESWLPADAAREFALDKELLMADHFDPDNSAWNRGGVIYEKMLSPLFTFSLSGVIWYQGESDTSSAEGEIYDAELLRFMRAVREGFGDDALPFAVIQIADLDWRLESDSEGWTSILKAQERAVKKDANSVLIISKDVCESDLIHPTKKTELSVRTAKTLINQ